MVRELILDEPCIDELRTYEGLIPTSMHQLERIVTKKDTEIELLKLKIAQLMGELGEANKPKPKPVAPPKPDTPPFVGKFHRETVRSTVKK